MFFLCSGKKSLPCSKYSVLSSHWCCFPTLLCFRVLPCSPDHVWPASCPYLTVLFGQQQEAPTCVCVPLMKHHVQMLAFAPQVYDHCIDRCLNLNDLSLLLACWELFYELQGKLILYVCFLASYSACYSCFLKEMGQELSSSVVSTRICAAVPKDCVVGVIGNLTPAALRHQSLTWLWDLWAGCSELLCWEGSVAAGFRKHRAWSI